VIVLHEMFGVSSDMRGVAERFASEGYVAVVPDLFAHGRRALCIARAMREISSLQHRGRLLWPTDLASGQLTGVQTVP
jgi:carboxymethylenebutenolidase